MKNDFDLIYWIISGAGIARDAPQLLNALTGLRLPIYTFLTDNAHRIISPNILAAQSGHKLVDSYFDPILINGRQPGLTLVAPATFNTVNKISQGIADNLALSLVAEAIGGGWPVIIAPALNTHLSRHPRLIASLVTLREWGVTVLDPVEQAGRTTMVPIETIVSAVADV